MADVYLIDINQNDSLNDVIRKCNHNFKVAYSGQQRQTRNYVQREQADVTARLEGIEEGLEDEATARSNADSNLSIRIDNIHQLPAGGTVGQFLAKRSNADGDAEWKDPSPRLGYEPRLGYDTVNGVTYISVIED